MAVSSLVVFQWCGGVTRLLYYCRHEYGEAELTLELVSSMDEAIDHLHANGSGHTECIVTGMASPCLHSAYISYDMFALVLLPGCFWRQRLLS